MSFEQQVHEVLKKAMDAAFRSKNSGVKEWARGLDEAAQAMVALLHQAAGSPEFKPLEWGGRDYDFADTPIGNWSVSSDAPRTWWVSASNSLARHHASNDPDGYRTREEALQAAETDYQATAALLLPEPTTASTGGVGISREMVEMGAEAARARYAKMIGDKDLVPWRDADTRPSWLNSTQAALTAAFPHAKPVADIEREVIERLAENAKDMVVAHGREFTGVDPAEGTALSEWLRSQLNTEEAAK